MEPFATAIDIDAPPERVWEVMLDVDRWHEWTPSVSGIRRVDRGPLAVGSQVIVRQPKLPPAKWVVTAIEEGRGFTWESVGPGFRVVGRHEVEFRDGESRARLSLEHHGIVGRLIARLTAGITRRYIAYEAEGLKARSEDPGFVVAGGPS